MIVVGNALQVHMQSSRSQSPRKQSSTKPVCMHAVIQKAIILDGAVNHKPCHIIDIFGYACAIAAYTSSNPRSIFASFGHLGIITYTVCIAIRVLCEQHASDQACGAM